MKMILWTVMLIVFQTNYAQNYQSAMQTGLDEWEKGATKNASAIFERVAAAERHEWLPDYYLAMVNITAAFDEQDDETSELMLKKAEEALSNARSKIDENAELLVLEALIYTAKIAKNPSVNGQKYAPRVHKIYARAIQLAPDNPRVVLEKAQFEMGSAKYFGKDTQPICKDLDRALRLFDEFEKDGEFSPDWGKDQAITLLKDCK